MSPLAKDPHFDQVTVLVAVMMIVVRVDILQLSSHYDDGNDGDRIYLDILHLSSHYAYDSQLALTQSDSTLPLPPPLNPIQLCIIPTVI